MIGLLLIIPIIGSLLIIPVQINENDSTTIIRKKERKIINISLITSLINLIISIYMYLIFDPNTSYYQFVFEFNNLSFCHFNVGIDGISLYFVLLTTFVTPIALLSSYTNIKTNSLPLSSVTKNFKGIIPQVETRKFESKNKVKYFIISL